MIDTAKIKANILSCAFKGMLVDFNVEKSNEALDELHKENKKYVPVKEDEFLTEVPSRWQWSRLGYVTNNHGQKEPQEDFCYIDVGTLDNINHCLAKKENLVNKEEAPSRARKIVEQGDVLYSTVRPYLHNICIINKDFSRMPVASTAFCVMAVEEKVLINKYLFYWLLSPEFDKFSNGNPSKGTLYPAIGEKDLLNGVIPIPDIEEQKLIVEKLDSAFEHLDKLNRLQILYTSDLEVLKSKIIDAGIQGKLTEQLPEDGTAEELIEQIAEEKKQLIKEKKIKATKALSEITEDEIPFEIPGNWKWTRLNDIGLWSAGATPSRRNMSYYSGCIPWVKTGELNNGVLKQTEEHISELALKECSVRLNPIGSVLIAMYGATIGKVSILDIEATTNQACCACIPYMGVHNKYLFYYLISHKEDFISKSHGGAQPNISKDIIINELIPLPPYEEQIRIADKLEELLGLI